MYRFLFIVSLLLLGSGSVGVAQPMPEEKAKPLPKVHALPNALPDWGMSVAFSPDAEKLAAGTFDVVKVWGTDRWNELAEIKHRSGYAYGLAWSPDGSRLAVGGYQKITIYDGDTYRRVKTLRGHRGYVRSVKFHPTEPLLLSASEDRTARVWNTESGEITLTLTAGEYPVRGAAWSPDGALIALAIGDETRISRPGPVRLYDATSGELVKELAEHLKVATSVVFSPSGGFLVTTSDDEKANVYDVTERKAVGFYSGHSRATNAAVFAEDDRTVFSVSGGRAKGKNELKVWDRLDGREWGGFEAHPARINAVDFAPDQRWIVTTSHDKSVMIWDAGGVLDEVREELGDMLDPVETIDSPREPVVAPRP